jgi:mRNA degradation ribonuclease J1/J2
MPGQDKENKYVLVHELKRRGFTVMSHPEYKLYPHAHARQKEIVQLAKLSNAKSVIPVHGDKSLREANQALLKDNGIKTLMAENGQTIRLKAGKASIAREYTETPHYIGFETRTGNHWTDRDYVVKMTVNQPDAANENTPEENAQRRKPRLFGHDRRF